MIEKTFLLYKLMYYEYLPIVLQIPEAERYLKKNG